jgi:hypothetical protein
VELEIVPTLNSLALHIRHGAATRRDNITWRRRNDFTVTKECLAKQNETALALTYQCTATRREHVYLSSRPMSSRPQQLSRYV